jgi:hypothetical protein
LSWKVGKKGPPADETLRGRAERMVWNKTTGLWLLYNIGFYLIINALIIAIWAVSGRESYWFLWVVLIWAGALVIHFVGYFVGYRHGAKKEEMVQDRMQAYRVKKGLVTEEAQQPTDIPQQHQPPSQEGDTT